MNFLAVIPARYASQRFPGKPLALLDGRPMIQWVVEAARESGVFAQVVVATDHHDIVAAVKQFGGEVEWTRSDHASGTDRVAEVAERRHDADIVVNVQGDQPFVTGNMLRELVQPFAESPYLSMTTLACPIRNQYSENDPNTVKVVCDQHMNALYFSRANIPFYRQQHTAPVYHHLGLYAFARPFLQTFTSLEPTPLEQCEQLEQLRVLENGYAIRVALTEKPVLEINTPDDLQHAHEYLGKRLAS